MNFLAKPIITKKRPVIGEFCLSYSLQTCLNRQHQLTETHFGNCSNYISTEGTPPSGTLQYGEKQHLI